MGFDFEIFALLCCFLLHLSKLWQPRRRVSIYVYVLIKQKKLYLFKLLKQLSSQLKNLNI